MYRENFTCAYRFSPADVNAVVATMMHTLKDAVL